MREVGDRSMSALPRARSRLPFLSAAVAIAAIAWMLPPDLDAQTDHSTVIRVLRESSDFRARVRAALALGSSSDPGVTPELVLALRDQHPAVRAAAATGLGRIGSAQALTPLRGALSDEAEVVRLEARRAIQRIESLSPNGPPPTRVTPPLTTVPAGGANRYPPIQVLPSGQGIPWAQVHYLV